MRPGGDRRGIQGASDQLGAVKLLLVNPPIYDFTAFDFWLRP